MRVYYSTIKHTHVHPPFKKSCYRPEYLKTVLKNEYCINIRSRSASSGTLLVIFAVIFCTCSVQAIFFTSTTPDKDQKRKQLFYFCSFKSYNPETFMSSTAMAFVHATRKCSRKWYIWFPWMDSHDSSTIQQLLYCSTWNKVFPLSSSQVTCCYKFCYFTLETLTKIHVRTNQWQSFLND